MSTDVHHPNPYDATEAENFVSVCSWCPELNILKLQRRSSDVVVYYQMGKDLRIMRNGTNLTISHGMCPSCKAAQLSSVSQDASIPVAPAEVAAETGAGPTQEDKQTPAPAAPTNYGAYPYEAMLAERNALLSVLRGGFNLIESSVSHVSHGGPTRAEAEIWLTQARQVLRET